jgi:hypothetical protein
MRRFSLLAERMDCETTNHRSIAIFEGRTVIGKIDC